ncbi:uncharacterized protein LOC120446377 [Drosophila santomea]|uniref:uncharacterized protein LOC120446377 n=1 Tax=Drosophila santomea TaxID=129105 RepID=UPI00195419A7|nr:uncharacterized protein LOC120446377 [Drosophila santomea]
MGLLSKNIILFTLLSCLEVHGVYQEKSSINLPSEEYTMSSAHTTGMEETSAPVEGTSTVFPPIRCLSCKYCSPNEDKSKTEKGKKMCPIVLGELNGCVSMFFNFPNSAGGPDGYMERSCISDMDEFSLVHCAKHEKLCEKCFDDDCNYVGIDQHGLVTNAGSRIMYSSLMIFCLTGWLFRSEKCTVVLL